MALPTIFPVTCHTDFVGKGSTFVAIRGKKEDGIIYIPTALAKGATTIVIDEQALVPLQMQQLLDTSGAHLIRVADTRYALAVLSAQAAAYPVQQLRIIGITGTNGKTTTAFLLFHILKMAGYRTALISTVYNIIQDEIYPSALTTPHPDYLHQFFAQCVMQDITYVVMEVAAQALTLHRTVGISFAGAIFTNFSQEHGEFYNSQEDYLLAKCQLFAQCKADAPVLINADDEQGKKLLANHSLWYSFSTKQKAASFYGVIDQYDTQPLRVCMVSQDTTYDLVCPPLVGQFNGYNMISASGMAFLQGISWQDIISALTTFTPVPGRLEMHRVSNGVRWIIDYAHNPSSYASILPTLRAMTNHLIVVFGAGGDRDKSKRPLMGSLAVHYADLVILTADNPRSEDPYDIIMDIMQGIGQHDRQKIVITIDRERAIRLAYALAQPTSLIALLGKGPDEYQIIGMEKIRFSERELIWSLR